MTVHLGQDEIYDFCETILKCLGCYYEKEISAALSVGPSASLNADFF